MIELVGVETLKCASCSGNMRNQEMHLYLNADDEIEETLCNDCWRARRREWAHEEDAVIQEQYPTATIEDEKT